MSFVIHGLPVTHGTAIGRAVLMTSSRINVARYLVEVDRIDAEIARLREARDSVVADLEKLQRNLPVDAPRELPALLEVHLMMLQDDTLGHEVEQWIHMRRYNAEWALLEQFDELARRFDDMQDAYLRERKTDLEQVIERMITRLKGKAAPQLPIGDHPNGGKNNHQVLIAHDLMPGDLLQLQKNAFAGFVTDLGGQTSHTAIVARSMDLPAVVGVRSASQLVRDDDLVIVDGEAGVLIVNPSPAILGEYHLKQHQGALERGRLALLKNTPTVSIDGVAVDLMINIEKPDDSAAAIAVGAVGVGLFRSEFLFMGRGGRLPDENEQYQAYRQAVHGMSGLPLTIRTVDVGADKPIDERHLPALLNPALGLRAIRWSLTEPAVFLTQLRAILRAARHGAVHLLIPMIAHQHQIRQTLALLREAKTQLERRGDGYGPLKIGAMIEVPAAALCVEQFVEHFDFLSIGTNDLIQYTLAIDRADDAVAHLYEPLHPAILQLLSRTIAVGAAAGKPVTVCGEMAGDARLTKLLLGLGLRSFSMHPSHLLPVKQEILQADVAQLTKWAQTVLTSHDPAELVQPPT